MTTTTFDALAYFEKLKAAGVPEEQARVQAEALRSQSEAQAASMRQMLVDREKELATRTDLKELEIRLLKWQIAGWVSLATIMAKGFGWLGF